MKRRGWGILRPDGRQTNVFEDTRAAATYEASVRFGVCGIPFPLRDVTYAVRVVERFGQNW